MSTFNTQAYFIRQIEEYELLIAIGYNVEQNKQDRKQCFEVLLIYQIAMLDKSGE